MRDFVPQFVKMLDKPIDVDEIKKAALKLKNGKSVGIDLISNEMIKCRVDSHFVRLIRELFNFESKVPTCWKQGLRTPIFKSGEIYNPSDYRAITVTSCLSKLFTLIINERLVSFIDTKAILKPNLIGFRRKFRISDNIFVLNTLLNSYFANGKPVYSCFVDFSKAYDSVWRDGLVYKLILRKFSYRFISLISSMYHGLTSAVKLSNGITPFFESFVGLR